jgi:hyperosmotically inducible periplasmic protein
MKRMCSLSLLVAAITLLTLSLPLHASQMDCRIELSFKTYLSDDDNDIKIESVNGVVSLAGIVSEEALKAFVQEAVAGLSGVKSVVNRLEVKRERLRSVSAGATEIDVKDGAVTRQGPAASQPQKDLTAEYAKDVDGFQQARDEMVVTSPSKKTRTVGDQIGDAFITAKVKITLLYQYLTSALNIPATTEKGVVTLGGKAGNAAQVNLATKLSNE